MSAEYLTTDEVASRLQVSRQVVYNWINDGRLRAVKAGRTLRIPSYALDAFLEPVHAGDIRAGSIEPDHFMPVDQFTSTVRAVQEAASSEVLRRRHLQIEVEHMLWAMVQQADDIVPQVLQQLGIDPLQVSQQLEQVLAKLPSDPNFQHSQQTMLIDARVPPILHRAEELASLVPDLQIDTSHLLLAICEETDGASAQILQSFGITPERLQVALSDFRNKQHQAAEPQGTPNSRAEWEQRIEQQLTRIETELAALHSILTRFG